MVADSLFSVVSKVDHQKMDNAPNQVAKKVSQRSDFKNTDSSTHRSGDAIEIESSGEERAKTVLGVSQPRLIKRGVPLKALDAGESRISERKWKITCTTKQGIRQEDAKKISKLVYDEDPKGMRMQIQGNELRVSLKPRDHLQEIQRLIERANYDFAVQFVNYR